MRKRVGCNNPRPRIYLILTRKFSISSWELGGASVEAFDQPRENQIKHIKRTEALALDRGPDAGFTAGYRFLASFTVVPHISFIATEAAHVPDKIAARIWAKSIRDLSWRLRAYFYRLAQILF